MDNVVVDDSIRNQSFDLHIKKCEYQYSVGIKHSKFCYLSNSFILQFIVIISNTVLVSQRFRMFLDLFQIAGI